jgi:hypothetical protein
MIHFLAVSARYSISCGWRERVVTIKVVAKMICQRETEPGSVVHMNPGQFLNDGWAAGSLEADTPLLN